MAETAFEFGGEVGRLWLLLVFCVKPVTVRGGYNHSPFYVKPAHSHLPMLKVLKPLATLVADSKQVYPGIVVVTLNGFLLTKGKVVDSRALDFCFSPSWLIEIEIRLTLTGVPYRPVSNIRQWSVRRGKSHGVTPRRSPEPF